MVFQPGLRDKFVKLDPKYAIFYNNRGVTKKKLGDYEGACSDWSKAGELGDGDAYQLIREYCNSN